jgi:hypothetical protein
LLISLLTLLISSQAHASAVTLGPAAGYDFSNDSYWSGLSLALRPNNITGYALRGHIIPGWGFTGGQPQLETEFGLVRGFIHPEAIIRVGGVTRWTVTQATYRLPIEFTESPLDSSEEESLTLTTGVIPAVMFVAEFEWRRSFDYGMGVSAGLGSELSNQLCPEDELFSDDCLVWVVGFTGGFTGWLELKNGFGVRTTVGPSSNISLNWRL